MTTSNDLGSPPAAVVQRRRRPAYWVPMGLFCALFLFSGIWSIIDPDGARATMVHLGFPTYFLYPQSIAKVVGVGVILWGGSRTLSGLAFAGFVYDLLLAGGAHIAEGDPDVWLAVFGLVVTAAAFWADRQRFPRAPIR